MAFSIFVSSLVAILLTFADCKCPEPFEITDGYCLYFGSKSMDFFRAWERCASFGGQLVSVESEYKLEAIAYRLNNTEKYHWWTSGTSLAQEEKWVWMSTGRFFDYTAWNSGEPNLPETERCMFLSSHGVQTLKFMNYVCGQDSWDNVSINYICEYNDNCCLD